MKKFIEQYAQDSCGAISYEEYLEGRLESALSQINATKTNIEEGLIFGLPLDYYIHLEASAKEDGRDKLAIEIVNLKRALADKKKG